MVPEANVGWTAGQQPPPNHWWKHLAAHKLWLIAGIAATVLVVAGIVFMFMAVKNGAQDSSSPDGSPAVTTNKPNANSGNTTSPSATSDKPGQDAANKPQGGGSAKTPGATSQGSGNSSSGSDNNGGGGSGRVGCGLTTQHVPDGPDGMGGCWPGPSNTGPNAAASSMAAYSGSCTINSANVVIDSKVINCSPLNITTGASSLVIKNSYINGGVINANTESFTIQDSLLNNGLSYPACSGGTCSAGTYACGDPNNATFDCGVGYKNFTILRTEIINSNRAAYCESTCTIQDSYFHGTNLWPDVTNLAHASSVRNEQYLTLRHNALGCDYTGPFPNGEIGCSADMSGYADFAPITHDTIDKNLFLSNNIGIAYCAYGGGTAGKPYSSDPANATYIVFTNNIFQGGANGKCGQYGPVTDFVTGNVGNVWSNNKYDNGATVDAF